MITTAGDGSESRSTAQKEVYPREDPFAGELHSLENKGLVGGPIVRSAEWTDIVVECPFRVLGIAGGVGDVASVVGRYFQFRI